MNVKIERLFILLGVLIEFIHQYYPNLSFNSILTMSLVSSSFRKNSYQVVNLPYDIINAIFEILSQITDNGESGYYLEVTNRGKIRLMVRPSFTGIFDITRFKQKVSARYVELVVQQWTPNGEPAPQYTVTALEQPHRIHTQSTIDEDYRSGFVSDNRCYTYSEPDTNIKKIAYVESRIYYEHGTIVFHQGCVYGENDEYHVISGFGATSDGTARLVVNPFNMIWDLEGDEHWADNLEAAEALLELGGEFQDAEEDFEEFDFDALAALPLLQMYM